jgi:hypothetical protein
MGGPDRSIYDVCSCATRRNLPTHTSQHLRSADLSDCKTTLRTCARKVDALPVLRATRLVHLFCILFRHWALYAHRAFVLRPTLTMNMLSLLQLFHDVLEPAAMHQAQNERSHGGSAGHDKGLLYFLEVLSHTLMCGCAGSS